MKRRLSLLVMFLFAVITPSLCGAETIWQEDFSSYVDVGIDGTGNINGYPEAVTKWSIDVTSCELYDSGNYFLAVDTSGGRMEAKDINGEGVWRSEVIDISLYHDIEISVDVSETGGSGNTAKYVKLYYILNSGEEQPFEHNFASIGDFGSAVASQTNINGESLQVVARVSNPNAGDKVIFDNVLIAGEPGPPDEAPPLIFLEPATNSFTACVSNEFSLWVTASNAAGGNVELKAIDKPSGAAFVTVSSESPVSGEFRWTPVLTDTGEHEVVFQAGNEYGTNTETVTISVLDRVFGWESSSEDIDEDAGTVTVAVVLSRSCDAQVEIGLSGTADEGAAGDYTIAFTSITFSADGGRTQLVELVIHDDSAQEEREKIILTLQQPVNGTILPETAALELSIRDNDSLFIEPFDSDPGWTTEGRWAFGPPLGDGSAGDDPSAAYSGDYVYGYNPGGKYANNISPPDYLTTPAIDCSAYTDVTLTFQRWLAVESASWDHAAVQISVDGMTWHDIWEHTGSTLQPTNWTQVSYDISVFADQQETVYLRWAMGETDYSVTYGGWSIDDVELTGTRMDRPVFSVHDTLVPVLENSSVVTVKVERSGITTGEVSVGYASRNGTALAGEDYSAVTGRLVFAAGEVLKNIEIQLLDDSLQEGNETFSLDLNTPSSGAMLGVRITTEITVLDDEAPQAAFPFFDGFEAGTLSDCWTASSTSSGRIRVGGDEMVQESYLEQYAGAYEGDYHLGMDAVTSVSSLNELILNIDLSGQSNVLMSVMVKDMYDSADTMPQVFSGSENADGIAVSADGYHWYRIAELDRHYPPVYSNVFVNLSRFAVSNGISLGEHFKIKYQQYGSGSFDNYEGRMFDNILIYDGGEEADLCVSVSETTDPVAPGEMVEYTIIISNAGPGDASAVVVSNGLPDAFVYDSADLTQGTANRESNTVYGMIGDMTAGTMETFIIQARAPETGRYTNAVSVRADTSDMTRQNNRTQETTLVSERGGDLVFETIDYQVREGIGGIYITVLRTNKMVGEVSAEIAVDGTAVLGVDCSLATQMVTFANGESSRHIFLAVTDDDQAEPTETLRLVLTNLSAGASCADDAELLIEIDDNDGCAAYPFREDFESGKLTNCWKTYSDDTGRIRITANNIPYEGYRHLTMDRPDGSPAGAPEELILCIDLAGKNGVYLQFAQKEFYDTDQVMSNRFSGHENSDGVALSVDGTNWVKVQGLTDAEGSSEDYRLYDVSLDAVMTSNSLTYTDRVYIKFQHYGYGAIDQEGFAFDDISVYSRKGTLQFSSETFSTYESDGTALVTVARTLGTEGEVSVDYRTQAGSAVSGVDYTDVSGTLVFPEGVATKQIAVPITDDDDTETTETILVVLENALGGAQIGTHSNTTIQLADNDGPGSLTFAQSAVSVTETNGTTQITVLREGGNKGTVRVDYRVGNGSADAGSDYLAETGTLTFADGVVSQTFAVTILDDDAGEPNETVDLVLANAENGATLGRIRQIELTIVDNDDPYYIYYASAYGKTGTELRGALHEIIDDHTIIRYDWAPSQELDENPDNANQILTIYGQYGIDKNAHGTSSGLWNREHVWSKSHGFSGDPDISKPASVDLHNLRAVEHSLNSTRNDRDYDEGGERIENTPEGCRKSNANWSFEPPDVSKGDVARTFFYMAVRYEGNSALNEPDLEISDEGTATEEPRMGVLSRLIRWHFEDPPDAFEYRRNNLIYTNYQHNRNPFIDHPEWVSEIWGHRINTEVLGSGSVSPVNPLVNYGYSQEFTITADAYYHVASVQTNATEVYVAQRAADCTLTWSDVKTGGTLAVVFDANIASNNVPEWWLAQYGLTNDFIEASTTDDADRDGIPSWQEWVAGTVPTDNESCFAFSDVAPDISGRSIVLRWQGKSGRRYEVFAMTNLVDGTMQSITQINVHADGMVYCTNAIDELSPQKFYIIEVQNPDQ